MTLHQKSGHRIKTPSSKFAFFFFLLFLLKLFEMNKMKKTKQIQSNVILLGKEFYTR